MLQLSESIEEMAFELLGGKEFSGHDVRCSFEAHDMIVEGIRVDAVLHMIDKVSILSSSDVLARAVGVTHRSLQRKTNMTDGVGLLAAKHGSRAWRFAEIFSQAKDSFGDTETAEKWMVEPSSGLGDRRPIDLIMSCVGAELVETYLKRANFGRHT